ncbi:uncharacterized protein LOC129913968 [Episyrphus balteatus]|uniref:uncharacterized protein LOC129913968 n=1 Tax=Episyrphus balteatus TaxID=286459 RepID=UPI00248500AB|nr:uncharacterized protein LOC129913968 [Episyrphus balteatus]
MQQKHHVVDIRSDTISQPTAEMRKAMFEAIVGDDVYHEDPTVKELENKGAQLFKKEAGLFVPSGTMGNLLAVMVHCSRRGTEAIVGDLSHIFLYEQGGAAHIAGVQLATIKNKPDGTFCLNELKRKFRPDDCHEPSTALVIVENTHNMCGGRVLPLEWLDQLADICKKRSTKANGGCYGGNGGGGGEDENDVGNGNGVGGKGGSIALHMDGARVFNAAEAMGTTVDRIARDIDSVCFCLSKGLSAPVGSMLVGSKDFINEARRLRKALGGGMRQAGILAAAGLVALSSSVKVLKEHHRRTYRIAEAIHKLKSPFITVHIDNVQTNILLIHIKTDKITASDFAARLGCVTDKELAAGVVADKTNPNCGIILKVSSRDWEFARVVLYQQITDLDIDLAIKKLNYVIREYDSQLAH